MHQSDFKKAVESYYDKQEQKPIPVIKFTSKRKLKRYLKNL